MKTWDLFLKGGIFAMSNLTLLLLLSLAIHFPVGRVLFAIAVSGICFIAECFAFFKVTQLLWRWSIKAALAILRIVCPSHSSPAILTRREN
jgi:hypothetical protein